MKMDVKQAAGVAVTVVQKIEEFEPTAATVASMVIPGAAPIATMGEAWGALVLGLAERALGDIANGNGGDVPAALVEFLNHISAGKPNASALAPNASAAA